ncbi:hypothetical protein DDY07_02875 [Methylomonas sp. ZR1]|nr:hypothetical protein [Methylomonas sp. ZR1]
MSLVFGGPGMALPKTLAKSEKRRIKAEFRVAFSLDTFFWPSKRKYLGCRAETRLQNNPSRQRHFNADSVYGSTSSPRTESTRHL